MLDDLLKSQGNRLFRYRSVIPLLLLFVCLYGASSFTYPYNDHNLDFLWDLLCKSIGLIGIFIRVLAVGFSSPMTSGRNRSEQVAHSLNTTGMYSICRNPLYLGNFLIWGSIILLPRSLMALFIYIGLFILLYERIILTEEDFLKKKFSDTYSQWVMRTPLFIPNFQLWKKPSNAFSLKKSWRQEYQGIFSWILVLFIVETACEYTVYSEVKAPDMFWLCFLILGTIFYSITRILHKQTNLLSD